MQDIRRIVAAVDFHRHTDTVAEYARLVAGKLGAQLTFVSVVESLARSLAATDLSGAVYGGLFPASYLEIDADLLKLARERMQALVEHSRTDLADCAGEVLEGDPADRVVAFAAEQQADLIVLGTHGSRGIEKILLGSVAERVLKRAACPVLVVNPYRGEQGYRITRSPGDAATSV
ncbi:MAG: universal stress protein [Desulfobulbus sp.]|uniref:universal stress protein n=1 Tax=uncultured Desulfobulbus sp. TaxID=239745 RepID=UPI001B7A9830|nr:universal stress protein [uncultured Desulfobulbus sp.]MBP7516839.1 universal stress protein [Desulfobulbus sp.]